MYRYLLQVFITISMFKHYSIDSVLNFPVKINIFPRKIIVNGHNNRKCLYRYGLKTCVVTNIIIMM